MASPSVGARVEVAGRGRGTVALDNEDGTWNVDLDDGSEGDFPEADVRTVDESPADMALGSSTDPKALLIWCHGRTDTPDGWYSIFGAQLGPMLATLQIKLPCAPMTRCRFTHKIATSWFDIKGFPVMLAREDPGTGQDESIGRVVRMVEEAVSAGIPASCIVLGGHSQGGALALAAALRSKVAVAACIVLAGWALPAQKLAQCGPSSAAISEGTRFLVCHGEQDSIVLPECGHQVAELLQQSGCAAERLQFELVEGMGHNGCPKNVLDSIQQILCDVLA